MDDPQHWMQKVSEVFDTNPRNGNRAATVWLNRSALEKDPIPRPTSVSEFVEVHAV